MATKNKTAYTGVNINDFLDSFVNDEQKKTDSLKLVELMRLWSGCEPRMWGPSIIGFCNYHYKYASGHEGDAPVIAFSPRKAAITLYVFSPKADNQYLLDDFGKFKITKGCIYIKKLSDISIPALEKICKYTMDYIAKHHECDCR